MPSAAHIPFFINATPGTSVPGVPTSVTSSTSGTTATLSWAAPASNGGSPITGYLDGRDGTDATGAGAYSTTDSASTFSRVFSQLVAGNTYTLSVAAVNAVGTGPAVTRTVTIAATAPGVPTSVTATQSGSTATLSWVAPTNNGGSAITGYTIARDGTDSTGAGAYSNTVAATATSVVFNNMVAGSTYNLSVAAVNAVGSSSSVSVAITMTSSSPAPVGAPGNWSLAFQDEFTGSSLDTTKWAPNWYGEGGTMNGVGTYAANVAVTGGNLILTLASSSSGALVHTDISGGYKLPVGSFAEARINFPGSSSQLYNWPAWWASTSSADGWPSAGEHDIAEVLGGTLTVNYHSPSGSHNQGAVSGTWQNGFHTYGIYRKASSADVYWDGTLVKSYSTDDSGNPEILILNVGASTPNAYGTTSQVLIDYVRAWSPV